MKARQTQRMNEAKNYNPEGYATVQKSPVAKKRQIMFTSYSSLGNVKMQTSLKILNENVK